MEWVRMQFNTRCAIWRMTVKRWEFEMRAASNKRRPALLIKPKLFSEQTWHLGPNICFDHVRNSQMKATFVLEHTSKFHTMSSHIINAKEMHVRIPWHMYASTYSVLRRTLGDASGRQLWGLEVSQESLKNWGNLGNGPIEGLWQSAFSGLARTCQITPS